VPCPSIFHGRDLIGVSGIHIGPYGHAKKLGCQRENSAIWQRAIVSGLDEGPFAVYITAGLEPLPSKLEDKRSLYPRDAQPTARIRPPKEFCPAFGAG